jgi:hypothetical protein
MNKLTIAIGIFVFCSSSAFAQKKTSHTGPQKLTVKTAQGEKHPPRSSAAPAATASTARQSNMSRELSRTEAQSASLLAGNGGAKPGTASAHALPAASAKNAQKSDRNAPIDFQYHPSKNAPATRPGGSTRSGKVH